MDVKTIVPTRRCRKCEQISTVTRNESWKLSFQKWYLVLHSDPLSLWKW
jgi:hypothetical protein